MKQAWVLLSLYLLSLTFLPLIRPSEPTDVKIILIATVILNPAILLYLIRFVRHQGANTGTPAEAPCLSTWGYFWRAFILYFFHIPLLIVVNLIVPLNLQASKLTPTHIALWELPFALVSAIGAWILFSKDRRSQVRLLFASFGGY